MDEIQSDSIHDQINATTNNNNNNNNNNPNEKDDSEPIVIITSSMNANSKMAHQQLHSPNEALKDLISLEVYIIFIFFKFI